MQEMSHVITSLRNVLTSEDDPIGAVCGLVVLVFFPLLGKLFVFVHFDIEIHEEFVCQDCVQDADELGIVEDLLGVEKFFYSF